MYENVDAVTDVPCCFYWDEILKAFPSTKIILTTRDEDDWWESTRSKLQAESAMMFRFLKYATPTGYRFFSFVDYEDTRLFGQPHLSLFQPASSNESIRRMRFREHNAHVMQ
uniref:Sulfotransferase n=1 Tax=Ciona savignyi TaxID=51511 RepID=H2Z1X3_CIOSA